MSEISIDFSKATDEELKSIKNEVIKRLAQRARTNPSMTANYDRHGSGHSRSSPDIVAPPKGLALAEPLPRISFPAPRSSPDVVTAPKGPSN